MLCTDSSTDPFVSSPHQALWSIIQWALCNELFETLMPGSELYDSRSGVFASTFARVGEYSVRSISGEYAGLLSDMEERKSGKALDSFIPAYFFWQLNSGKGVRPYTEIIRLIPRGWKCKLFVLKKEAFLRHCFPFMIKLPIKRVGTAHHSCGKEWFRPAKVFLCTSSCRAALVGMNGFRWNVMNVYSTEMEHVVRLIR